MCFESWVWNIVGFAFGRCAVAPVAECRATHLLVPNADPPLSLPQKLWATLAANRLNIVPSLNFLIDRGLKEDAAGANAGAVAATGKEVCAWLACLV